MQNVNIFTEFITLGQLLKFVGLISSGSNAKSFLIEHEVKINDEKENRRGRKLYIDYKIKIDDKLFQIKKGGSND